MPIFPIQITFTYAQAHALARVGEALAAPIADLFPDGRHRSAVTRAFDRITATIEGVEPAEFDLDMERFIAIFGGLRSTEMAELLRARVRDLLAVAILWSAVESIPGVAGADGLLGVPAVDHPAWRAEVLDLLIDRGVGIRLPGEVPGGGRSSAPAGTPR